MPGDDSRRDSTHHVVTAFLRCRSEVLLLRRSDAVGTYAGRWGAVSGYAEGDPDRQVRREILEETGLDPATLTLERAASPLPVEDEARGREWIVHPYWFECGSARRAIELSEEHTAFEWVHPTAIVTGEYDTVPGLWAAYERVAPTVRSIAADDEHGAAFLSIRALEVLRDRAGVLVAERDGASEPAEEFAELTALARQLLEVRPAMAVLRNRVNRAMAEAGASPSSDADTTPETTSTPTESADTPEATPDTPTEAADTPEATPDTPTESADTPTESAATPTGTGDAEAVLASTIADLERAIEADEATAARASEYATGRLLTHSRSGTVLEAILAGEPARVFIAESRPAREGITLAEALAETSPVTVHTDAATAHVLANEAIDCVLVGSDTVLPDGSVVNKAGTRAIAIAATREAIPVYAVAASDKVSTRETIQLFESGDRSAIYDGEARLDVCNPTFDVTPADCLSGIITEEGILDADAVAAISENLRALEAWLAYSSH